MELFDPEIINALAVGKKITRDQGLNYYSRDGLIVLETADGGRPRWRAATFMIDDFTSMDWRIVDDG